MKKSITTVMKKSIAVGSCALVCGAAAASIQPPAALAVSAPIHITDDVNLRAGTNSSTARVGGIYRGASPDFHCWAQGQSIGGVDVWFNVTYNGATGFYASYFDDSRYATDAQITPKYGIPQCGTTPVSAPAPARSSIYFSPYDRGSHELDDSSARALYKSQWWGSGCAPSAATAARSAGGGRPFTTVAGWSLGRVGVLRYLASASADELRHVGYVLIIDPGTYDEMTCDRQLGAGSVLARWLSSNPSGHLVVISSSQVSQQYGSRGIQESYYNAIRRQSARPGGNLRPRVLTCNYTFSHQQAFSGAQYWIQHQIGTSSCPTLRAGSAAFGPTAAWHP